MHVQSSLIFLLFLVLAISALTPSVLAQQVSGAMTGVITDPSGAPIPNADVTAVDKQRHTVWMTRTNEGGFYSLPRLPRREL